MEWKAWLSQLVCLKYFDTRDKLRVSGIILCLNLRNEFFLNYLNLLLISITQQ